MPSKAPSTKTFQTTPTGRLQKTSSKHLPVITSNKTERALFDEDGNDEETHTPMKPVRHDPVPHNTGVSYYKPMDDNSSQDTSQGPSTASSTSTHSAMLPTNDVINVDIYKNIDAAKVTPKRTSSTMSSSTSIQQPQCMYDANRDHIENLLLATATPVHYFSYCFILLSHFSLKPHTRTVRQVFSHHLRLPKCLLQHIPPCYQQTMSSTSTC
jgi:hypothetical protein